MLSRSEAIENNLALVQICSACGDDVLNYARAVGFEKAEQGRVSAAWVDWTLISELLIKAPLAPDL
jgi:hypothetical protein